MATKKVLTETGLSRLVGLINSKFAEKTEVPKKTSDITNDSGFITAASPELTGTPTAPTAASGTNTTQIATTAFVQNAVSNVDVDIDDITNTEIGNAWNNISIDPNVALPVTFNDLENYATKEEASSIAGYTHLLAFKQDPLNVNNMDVSNCTSLASVFYEFSQTAILCSDWDTSSVTDMSYMFSDCYALTSLNISNWNTSNVTNMNSMFSNCNALTSLDISDWNTSSVTNMNSMFSGCDALTSLDISDWDTSSVTNIGHMFRECYALTSLDISDWDTSSIINMNNMFNNCKALTSLDISDWDTSSVTDMSYMFSICDALTSLDISNLDTSSVTNMSYMFNKCDALQYLIINSSTFKFQAKTFIALPSTCKILVPSALIDTYKAATNWSTHASKFDAIENYTITHSNGQVTVTPNA